MRIEPPTFTVPATVDRATAADLAAIQSSPSVSFWLKRADAELARRDVLDALRDAEVLLQAARERARAAGVKC